MPHYNLPHNHGQNMERVLNKMPHTEDFTDIVIAVLIGLVSAIVGTWFAFFNPGIGVVMSVSIIGAAIIYLLSKGKDR